MIPAEKVATCFPTDSIKQAMDTMLKKNVGSVVVLETPGTYYAPVGIVTNTDFVSAYKQGLSLDHAVKEIMSKNLQTCDINLSIDGAAALLERNKTHHAIVVDGNKDFQGLISSSDIASECAKDNKAFPWNRSPDGRFHKPDEKVELSPGSRFHYSYNNKPDEKVELSTTFPSTTTSTAENVRQPVLHPGPSDED
jgi:CBS domain-containing protein